MKRLLAILLAAVMIAGLGCAYAGELTNDDLAGSWFTAYDGMIPIYCFLYEDGTFEALIALDLPVDELYLAGAWVFDGGNLALQCEDGREFPFAWNGKAFAGELFGLQVELMSEWMSDDLANVPDAEGTGQPD